jgi:hypothetical protein
MSVELQQGIYKIEVQCDSLYKDGSRRWCEIFSKKTDKIKEGQRIKKGEIYELTLNPYFMHDILVDFKIREVYISSIPIGISTGRRNIYTSPNLNGLYYIPFSKSE